MLLLTLFCQCSRYESSESIEEKLSETSVVFGKAVASDIRLIGVSLHKMGIDYSDADASVEFQQRYFNDISQIVPIPVTKNTVGKESYAMSPQDFITAYKTLTKIQIQYINRIVDDCASSTSYGDMMFRLSSLADEILTYVPEIQQERLQNVIAALYYGAQELQYLEESGLMVPTPNSGLKRIKTRSEASDGATCRILLETIWTIAVGEPTPTGEIVASIATVVIAGILYYEVVVCKTQSSISNGNFEYCQRQFERCFSPIPDGCSKCLEYCLTQGVWPPYNTHQCGSTA